MDLFTFKVDKFHIDTTRGLLQDTLHLAYAAYVNGDLVAQQVLHLGDFSSGDYNPNDFLSGTQTNGLRDVVMNDPTSIVGFIFQLVNAGNVPDGALAGRLAATGDQISGDLVNLAGAGAASASAAAGGPVFAVAVAVEALVNLYAWLSTDCDGPVAVDQVSGPRYVLDAWTDNSEHSILFDRPYPGSDSPWGCGANSSYRVSWSLLHRRAWVEVGNLLTGLVTTASATAHRGGLYVFGVDLQYMGITGYRTFTGANWERVTSATDFKLDSNLPVNAISFNDRLYLFVVGSDGSMTTKAYTVDGSFWTTFISSPSGLQTTKPITTVEFRNRLYLIARDSTSGRLCLTSTDDLEVWDPWLAIPEIAAPRPGSTVAAATLDGVLHIFGVYEQVKDLSGLLHNSTPDGLNWTGWREVEHGAHLEGVSDPPDDVAAAIFQSRIYLASRWRLNGEWALALNFSADGENWSGWRVPQSDKVFYPAGTTALASVGNHLYLFAPQQVTSTVYVY
jgi:hypothetical protein